MPYLEITRILAFGKIKSLLKARELHFKIDYLAEHSRPCVSIVLTAGQSRALGPLSEGMGDIVHMENRRVTKDLADVSVQWLGSSHVSNIVVGTVTMLSREPDILSKIMRVLFGTDEVQANWETTV